MEKLIIELEDIVAIRNALQVIQGNAESAYTRGSHTDEIIEQVKRIDKLLSKAK